MLSKNILAALVLAPMLAAAVPALAGPRYNVIALPELTTPSGINNNGQIVGIVSTPTANNAFVWANGALSMVGPAGAVYSYGTAINNGGVAVGYGDVGSDHVRAFSAIGGVTTPFDVAGASGTYATGINDSGVIVGQSYSAAGGTRAFSYSGGVATDLGDLGGGLSGANGINSAGHIVGFSIVDDTPFHGHGFYYADGVMHDLGAFPDASLSEATAINDHDQITGQGWVQGSFHAFLHENGVLMDLGTLGGRESFGFDINASGQIVGYSDLAGDFDTAAYLWENGVMTDLNALIDPADGWTLYQASGINDRGQIAGYGCRGDVCGGVLLDLVAAVPEPGTLVLLLAGLVPLMWRRRSAIGML